MIKTDRVKENDEFTATPVSEQPLHPDFEKLSDTQHEITEGAALPVANIDEHDQPDQPVVETRGRPRMTDAEREASRERKRERDRERARQKSGTRKKEQPATTSDDHDTRVAVAQVNAALIVSVLDTLVAAISAGEHVASDAQRTATANVWQVYLLESGAEIPAWVQVSIVSAMHVLPAFNTPTGRGRMAGVWTKIKMWIGAKWHTR